MCMNYLKATLFGIISHFGNFSTHLLPSLYIVVADGSDGSWTSMVVTSKAEGCLMLFLSSGAFSRPAKVLLCAFNVFICCS